MDYALSVGLFVVFAVLIGIQKGRAHGRRFEWPFGMTWRSGAVQNAFLAAWVMVLAGVVFAGSHHEQVAGASVLAAGMLMLWGGVRAITDDGARRALNPGQSERELRTFSYGITGMGVFFCGFGLLLLFA
jgi:hypothetical protein